MVTSIVKLLFLACLQYSGVNFAFRKINKGKIKTLMYHRITPDAKNLPFALAPDDLERQLVYLTKHFNVVSLTQSGEWVGLCRNRINVLLTFDDGFLDNYLYAYPLLKKYNVTGCFFLIAKCISSGCPPPGYSIDHVNGLPLIQTIGINQAKTMLANGMTIGSHSLEHLNFKELDFQAGIDDAIQSAELMRHLLQSQIRLFAFPWGCYRPGQLEKLSSFFGKIFTVEHGFNIPEDTVYCRSNISSLLQMYAVASGSLDYFRKLINMFTRNSASK